jgi:hypothetical protein
MRRYFNLFVVLTLTTLSRAQVRVWEGTLVLPTNRGCPIRILRLNGKNLQALGTYEDRSGRHNVGVALNNMNHEITRLKRIRCCNLK